MWHKLIWDWLGATFSHKPDHRQMKKPTEENDGSLTNGRQLEEDTIEDSAAPIVMGQSSSSASIFDEQESNVTRERVSLSAPIKESVLIFLAAVGSTISWTAVLSNLVFYTDTLGPDSYLFLSLAIYTPLFPTTWAQAIWDDYFDRRFQSLRSFAFRGHLGFAVTLLCTLLLPLASQSLALLSINSLFLGISSAILHGMLKQMAAFIYNCGRLPAAVTSGLQASAILVLLVSISSGFGRCSNTAGLDIFYFSIGALVFLCWACFQLLIYKSRDVETSMYQRDSSLTELSSPLIQGSSEDADNHQHDNSATIVQSDAPQVLQMATLLKRSWRVCLSIALTLSSSMAVASYFNRVKSQFPDNQALPQVLFYVRLFADLLGRPTTLVFVPKSVNTLLILSVLRLFFVPVFFVYIQSDLIPRNDIFATIGVFMFAFTSGYIVTLSYQLAPALLRDNERGSNTIKQASLINIFFSGAVVVGLAVALGLRGTGVI